MHNLFMRKQEELNPTAQRVELWRLCDIRWVCQYNATCAVKKTLPAIRVTLPDVITQSKTHQRAEVRAISAIINEKFVLHVIMFEDLFSTTNFMSDQLQAPNFDLVAAQSVLNALTKKHRHTKWNKIQQCVQTQAQHMLHMRKGSTPGGFYWGGLIETTQTENTNDMKTHSIHLSGGWWK